MNEPLVSVSGRLLSEPTCFDEVLNQGRAVNELRRRVQRKQHLPSIVLHGPKGVGKKTLARIYAEAARCEAPTEQGGRCDKCSTCKSFKGSGEPLGFVWANGAGEGLPRALRKLAQVGTFGERPLFVVVEAEKITDEGYDELLKAIEETQTTFVFVTDLEKSVRAAIRSRCVNYLVKPLSSSATRQFLCGELAPQRASAASQVLDVLVAHTRGIPGEMIRVVRLVQSSADHSLDAVRGELELDWPLELAGAWARILRTDIDGWDLPEPLRAVPVNEQLRRVRALLLYAINEGDVGVELKGRSVTDAALLHRDKEFAKLLIGELNAAAAERGVSSRQLGAHLTSFWCAYVPPQHAFDPPAVAPD